MSTGLSLQSFSLPGSMGISPVIIDGALNIARRHRQGPSPVIRAGGFDDGDDGDDEPSCGCDSYCSCNSECWCQQDCSCMTNL